MTLCIGAIGSTARGSGTTRPAALSLRHVSARSRSSKARRYPSTARGSTPSPRGLIDDAATDHGAGGERSGMRPGHSHLVADARFRRQDRRALLPRPQLRSGRSSATARASPARTPSGSQADSFPSRARPGRYADVQTGCPRARTRRGPERSQIVPRGSADRRPARMHARRSGRPHARRSTARRVIPRRRSRTGRTARGTAPPRRTKQAAYRPVGGYRRRQNRGVRTQGHGGDPRSSGRRPTP